MIANMLALEGLIKTQLETVVTELDVVSSWLDTNAESITQFSPAAYVLYGGYSIASDNPKGRIGFSTLIDQKWIIALVVRNAEGVLEGDKVKTDAGSLLIKIYKALNGIRLGEFPALKLINPGQSPKYYPGVGIFPIGFECRFILKGD